MEKDIKKSTKPILISVYGVLYPMSDVNNVISTTR